jgi:hypothetical protein
MKCELKTPLPMQQLIIYHSYIILFNVNINSFVINTTVNKKRLLKQRMNITLQPETENDL